VRFGVHAHNDNREQLRNLAACAEAGAVVLPAMPAF